MYQRFFFTSECVESSLPGISFRTRYSRRCFIALLHNSPFPPALPAALRLIQSSVFVPLVFIRGDNKLQPAMLLNAGEDSITGLYVLFYWHKLLLSTF